MMTVQARLSALLDRQHQYPSGPLGRVIGERMVQQHAPETLWSLAQLAITPTDHVLEIGFGAGRALALAADQATSGHIAGIDLSPMMVHVARRRNARLIQAGRLMLLRGNVTSLPFADEQFDKILSIHTFYFWPEPRQVLRDIVRILKPNGVLVLTLSTGRVTRSGERVFGPLHATLDQEIIPELRRIGCTDVQLRHGPDSRGYTSVAVVARK